MHHASKTLWIHATDIFSPIQRNYFHPFIFTHLSLRFTPFIGKPEMSDKTRYGWQKIYTINALDFFKYLYYKYLKKNYNDQYSKN